MSGWRGERQEDAHAPGSVFPSSMEGSSYMISLQKQKGASYHPTAQPSAPSTPQIEDQKNVARKEAHKQQVQLLKGK